MKNLLCLFILFIALASAKVFGAERLRAREMGIRIGVLPPGPLNAITDVAGVKVGHVTLIEGRDIRTGVTAILPHEGNIYQDKVPAAVSVANGYGKLTGSTQIEELGTMETPIILTNTLSVPTAAEALIHYTLGLSGNEKVESVNPVVGETNDGWLNDIRGRFIRKEHVLEAIHKSSAGPVEEGAVGAGTGTVCYNFKGGIGTASRRLSEARGGYTVGVLVQTNHGGELRIDGIQAEDILSLGLLKHGNKAKADGSCLIVVATDAPLDSRNLKRLAARALLGIPRTGGFNANGSGDYAIAFTAAPELRIPHRSDSSLQTVTLLRNEAISPLFQAAAEAAEEAILNSMFMAERMEGKDGHVVEALPIEKLRGLGRGIPKK